MDGQSLAPSVQPMRQAHVERAPPMKPLVLLAVLFAASVVLRRFRRDVRAMEELLDDDSWMDELVPMAATLPVAARN